MDRLEEPTLMATVAEMDDLQVVRKDVERERVDLGNITVSLAPHHLRIVNQLLTMPGRVRAGTHQLCVTPEEWSLVAPPSSPVYFSIYDSDNQTNSGLDNLDDGVLALQSLNPEKDRQAFVVDVAWSVDHRSRPDSGRQAAVPVMTLMGEPMRQGCKVNRDVDRRPERRGLSAAPQAEVDTWFATSGINLGDMCTSPEDQARGRRLAFTWKHVFAFCLKDVQSTDLVAHSVVLRPDALPYRLKQPKYTADEVSFAGRLHPTMEAAGFIVPGMSQWAAYTRYPLKKSGAHRFVCNYIPVNSWTIKPQWPTHCRDKVFDVLLQAGHTVFFQGDAANGYWSVPVVEEDWSKTAFVAPNMMYFMKRMPQGLTGSAHTYCALGDLAFGEWPMPANVDVGSGADGDRQEAPKAIGPALPSLMGLNKDKGIAFDQYIDDHNASADSVESMFNFLHDEYFPRVEFAKFTLTPAKTTLFGATIHSLGFELLSGRIRPAEKHRLKFAHWAEPVNHPKTIKELEEFLYLLPFLKQFIPGRVSRVLILKTAFMKRTSKLTPKGAVSKQKEWVPTSTFVWEEEHARAFVEICEEVQTRICTAPDREGQYHMTVDASDEATGGCLFQMADCPPSTQMTDKLMTKMRVLCFFSFKLEDAETRYGIGEREALGIVRGLREVRPWVIESPHPVLIYTDHLNLITTLTSPTIPRSRIALWLDELNMFDVQVVHRSNKTQIMGIADGLSRLTGPMADSVEGNPVKLECMKVSVADSGRQRLEVPACLGRPVMPHQGTILPFQASDNRRLSTPGVRMVRPYIDGSGWYDEIFWFLVGGEKLLEDMMEDVTSAEKRRVRIEVAHYKMVDGSLLRKESGGGYSLCVVESEVPAALRWAHDCHGHFSIASTIHKLRGVLWWPSRYSDVEQYVKSCDPCQAVSAHQPTSVDRIPVVSLRPWDLVGQDFTGNINPMGFGGETHIHVIVDYFTRFVTLRATCEPSSAEVVKTWDPIVNILGFPEEVYSDNGAYFKGPQVKTFFKTGGTRLHLAPVYSPESVGLVERMVRIVKEGLKKWAHAEGYLGLERWPDALPQIASDMNNRLPSGMDFTPSMLMLGWPARSTSDASDGPLMAADGDRLLPSVSRAVVEATLEAEGVLGSELQESFLDGREGRRRVIQDYWIARNVQAQPDNESPYGPGDLVWEHVPSTKDVKLRRFLPGGVEAHPDQRANAFKPRWTGPWRVDQVASSVSVLIQDAVTGRRQRKVHISNLKPYRRRDKRWILPENELSEAEDEIVVGGVEDEALIGAEGLDLAVPS